MSSKKKRKEKDDFYNSIKDLLNGNTDNEFREALLDTDNEMRSRIGMIAEDAFFDLFQEYTEEYNKSQTDSNLYIDRVRHEQECKDSYGNPKKFCPDYRVRQDSCPNVNLFVEFKIVMSGKFSFKSNQMIGNDVYIILDLHFDPIRYFILDGKGNEKRQQRLALFSKDTCKTLQIKEIAKMLRNVLNVKQQEYLKREKKKLKRKKLLPCLD